MITISMDVRSAAAVRQALFDEQKRYTYDPKCVPPRIVEIRNVITDLDGQIDEELNSEISETSKEDSLTPLFATLYLPLILLCGSV